MSDVETYADTLDVDCARCGSAAGARCVNPLTGQLAHCPCVTRLVGRPVAAPPKPKRTR